MSLSLYDLFISMGLFAKSILIILAAMSIYSWTSAFQKLYQIVRSQGETRRFAPEFSRFLQEEQLDGAIKLAEKQKKSHVARVVGEALAEVKPLLRDRATITAADINSVERAVEREILIVSAELKRGLGILATTGSTAPFVGLLGTVMGIVNAFTGMAASGGGGSLGAVSAGLALQLLLDQDRLPLRRDDVHLEGADRLSDQERRVGVRPLDLHEGIPDAEGVADQWPCQPLAPGRPSRPTSTSRR